MQGCVSNQETCGVPLGYSAYPRFSPGHEPSTIVKIQREFACIQLFFDPPGLVAVLFEATVGYYIVFDDSSVVLS